MSGLPYELITNISSFLHISDLVNLAVTCAHVHSCLRDRLEVHQHKLFKLGTINDRNRARATSILRSLFLQDSPSEDAWYFREAIIQSYQWSTFGNVDHNMSSLYLPDGQHFDMTQAVSGLGLRRFDWFYTYIFRSEDGFEGFLTLALLLMPRLSRLRFTLHPCHGHRLVYARSSNHAPSWTLPRAHVFEIFTKVIGHISAPAKECPWPPGLLSVQSIEVELDELHSFNRFVNWGAAIPRLYPEDLYGLFRLPNLKRLLLTRHPSAQSTLQEFTSTKLRLKEWILLDCTSSIEELVLVGFAGWQEYIRLMIQSVRRLRLFVLHQRGNEDQNKGIIQALQLRHASSLETIILPNLISNALSWCQTFSRLKYLTVSYVEIMGAFRKHQNHLSTSDRHNDEATRCWLATQIPHTVEFVVFIGGRQSSTITSVRAIPLYSDIQEFIAIVTRFVTTRGAGSKSSNDGEISQNLRDICFGDMRVAVVPQDAAAGKTLHQSYTKARELARLKLIKEVERSDKLKEVCDRSGVRLHVTDLKTRVCNHAKQHPYVARQRSSRQELIARAEKLSEDADLTVQTILSQYVDAIPKKYRP